MKKTKGQDMSLNSLGISPIMKEKLNKNNQHSQVQNAPEVQQSLPVAKFSPAMKDLILAQNNVNVPNVQQAPQVTLQTPSRVEGYKNNLKTKLMSNEATILAVIPRTMNAKDVDGNGLIENGEISGNFINAVERLDEIKNMGINTLHILPIQPPGKSHAMGTAGSVYAPGEFLAIDPKLRDPNDPRSVEEQCKYFIDECHKRGISVMLDLPSCVSVDYAKAHPELMATEKNGTDKTPQGWQDIRMFRFWDDEANRVLNPYLLDLHKKFVDMATELGFDGIRADVARAKPVEFWNVIIPYSHQKDPEFGWLAETYTYEDASPQLNMPHDRPYDQLKAGFDSYYGQYHIYQQWDKADDLHKYVKENIEMSNNSDAPKALIGSFATHDDQSPMFNGGAPWVMLTTALQATLPQLNPYYVDGVQSGDYYLYPYEGMEAQQTATDTKECTVHRGRLDIFNLSRKPGGNNPEIGEFIKSAMKLKNETYKDVINKGSYIPLTTNNEKVVAFLRHYNGKTLLTVLNRDINLKSGAEIVIPGLSKDQVLTNLLPQYGEKSYFQKQDGKLTVDLGPSRAHVFEINTPNIEQNVSEIYKQNNV